MILVVTYARSRIFYYKIISLLLCNTWPSVLKFYHKMLTFQYESREYIYHNINVANYNIIYRVYYISNMSLIIYFEVNVITLHMNIKRIVPNYPNYIFYDSSLITFQY